jgi:hypothetical protein
MTRAMVRHNPTAHEDYAIVSIPPLPVNAPMQFGPIREVVLEFLEEHCRISVWDIQPSHLGQALVCFRHAHDRDVLVNNSPFWYTDVDFHFVCHNEGRNWRNLNFNRDRWLMLLGFPLDYWNHESIQNAIAPFSKVMLWENDGEHLARLMLKAEY